MHSNNMRLCMEIQVHFREHLNCRCIQACGLYGRNLSIDYKVIDFELVLVYGEKAPFMLKSCIKIVYCRVNLLHSILGKRLET